MDGLEALQKRIKTTQDMRAIVSTMKSLSAVSVVQYDAALKSLSVYGETIDAGVVVLMRHGVVSIPKPKTLPPAQRRVLAVVIGSDTGLVGRLNRDIVAEAGRILKKEGYMPENVRYLAVGRQIIGLLERAEKTISGAYPVSNSVKAISTTAIAVLVKINELLQTEGLSNVYLFYQRKRGSSIQPFSSLMIPMGDEWLRNLRARKWNSRRFPIYTMSSGKLFSALMRERLMMTLSIALAEALTAEHHMRLTTMQAAEKNIDDNLEKMNQVYQQMRQENITTELLDVVNGAEAMRKKKLA